MAFFAKRALSTTRPVITVFSDQIQGKLRADANSIFRAALGAVSPQKLVSEALRFEGNILKVEGSQYRAENNVSVVAFGKAVLGMAKAAEDILGKNITRGIASIPFGLVESIEANAPGTAEFLKNALLNRDSQITVIEGAKNNLPDEQAHYAAREIKGIADEVSEGDILLVLISGGGSALLPYPVHGITLQEKLAAVKALSSAGATINELNTVRKNLSGLKGGKLAQAAYPASVVTLILSDVIGDPLDIIASGPTVPDNSTPTECLEIFKRLSLLDKIPTPVLNSLKEKEQHARNHSAISSDFQHVQNVIVGSNQHAVEAAVGMATTLGYTPIILSTNIDGIAREVGSQFADLARFAWSECTVPPLRTQGGFLTDDVSRQIKATHSLGKPICFIGAGETTVNLQGSGLGGRNQEMVLALAVDLHNNMQAFTGSDSGGLLMLSAGTDGQDGPTPAAGAIAEPHQVSRALSEDLDPVSYLNNNDSYTFYSKFRQGADHVVTGLTGTNVMDIQILLVSPPF